MQIMFIVLLSNKVNRYVMWISFKKYIKNTYNTRIEQNECLSYKDLHDFWCKYR